MHPEGLEFVGLHWLMVSPKGLHVTGPDAALRRAELGTHPRSDRSLRRPRARTASWSSARPSSAPPPADSPAKRPRATTSTDSPASRRTPTSRGVTVLVEALPVGQCDVVQTLEEAAGIVREIASPAVRTMFDVHNAVDEVEPHAALVDRYFDLIRHVHVNELDGRHCGTGDYDFKPVFEVAAPPRLYRAGFRSKPSTSRPAPSAWPTNLCAISKARFTNCHHEPLRCYRRSGLHRLRHCAQSACAKAPAAWS